MASLHRFSLSFLCRVRNISYPLSPYCPKILSPVIHNILIKIKLPDSILFCLCSSVRSFGTQRAQFLQLNRLETTLCRKYRETPAYFSRSSLRVKRRSSQMNYSTFWMKSSVTTDSRPLLSSSCTLVLPSRSCTHLATFWRFIMSGPYAWTSR